MRFGRCGLMDKEQLDLMTKQAFERGDFKELHRLGLVARFNDLR